MSRGAVLAVAVEEFGDDANLLLGEHADALASLSCAVLQTLGGERRLRALFRHLRSLLGSTPSAIVALQARLAFAEERTAAAVAAETRCIARRHRPIVAKRQILRTRAAVSDGKERRAVHRAYGEHQEDETHAGCAHCRRLHDLVLLGHSRGARLHDVGTTHETRRLRTQQCASARREGGHTR